VPRVSGGLGGSCFAALCIALWGCVCCDVLGSRGGSEHAAPAVTGDVGRGREGGAGRVAGYYLYSHADLL
jgi:hypothetical protein